MFGEYRRLMYFWTFQSCSLRDDLLLELKKLAEKKQFDYIVLEGSGVTEPMPIAEGVMNFDIGRGNVLADIGIFVGLQNYWNRTARLDTCVTVVDSKNFLQDYKSLDLVADRPELLKEINPNLEKLPQVKKKDEEDEQKRSANQHPATSRHSVIELLVEQIEYVVAIISWPHSVLSSRFSNVIIVNKVDLVTSQELESLERILYSLNPKAKSEFSQNFQTNFSVLQTNQNKFL